MRNRVETHLTTTGHHKHRVYFFNLMLFTIDDISFLALTDIVTNFVLFKKFTWKMGRNKNDGTFPYASSEIRVTFGHG